MTVPPIQIERLCPRLPDLRRYLIYKDLCLERILTPQLLELMLPQHIQAFEIFFLLIHGSLKRFFESRRNCPRLSEFERFIDVTAFRLIEINRDIPRLD